MRLRKQKVGLAIVTMEQALAFDPENPESWTDSRIVNAVLEAMGLVEVANRAAMARFLGISELALDGSVEFDTGLNFNDFVEQWRYQKILARKKKGQTRFSLEFVRSLGFANNSSLWHFMGRHGLLNMSRLEAQRAENQRIYKKLGLKK